MSDEEKQFVEFTTPLQAARNLDSLAEDIRAEMVEVVQGMNVSQYQRTQAIGLIEIRLLEVFMDEKVQGLRDYLYRGRREE